jgi:hypothetical protein
MPQTPEEKAAYQKKWYANNKGKQAAATKKWFAAHPHYLRNQLYNIDFLELLAKQGGKCFICGTTEPVGQGDGWAINHDHQCCKGGKSCGNCVKGILCQPCNKGLRAFKNNPDLIKAAQHYLLKYQDVLGIGNLL